MDANKLYVAKNDGHLFRSEGIHPQEYVPDYGEILAVKGSWSYSHPVGKEMRRRDICEVFHKDGRVLHVAVETSPRDGQPPIMKELLSLGGKPRETFAAVPLQSYASVPVLNGEQAHTIVISRAQEDLPYVRGEKSQFIPLAGNTRVSELFDTPTGQPENVREGTKLHSARVFIGGDKREHQVRLASLKEARLEGFPVMETASAGVGAAAPVTHAVQARMGMRTG